MSLKRNIVANYLGRAYSIGAIYLFVPFYIRILGIEAYGLIAFYSVILTLTALADVGLSTTFSREAARTGGKHRLLDLLTTIERILLLTTGLATLAVLLGAEMIASRWLNTQGALDLAETTTCLRLMSLTFVPQILLALYSAGLLGSQRQVLANGMQALYTTVRSGLVIAPIIWKPDPWVFFAWQLAATLVFAFTTRIALLRAMGHSWAKLGKFSLATTFPLVSFAGGMLAISIIASINTQLDKLVVSKMFPVADLGYYTLGGTLAQLPVAATTPLMIALFPRFTALIAEGKDSEVDRLYGNYSAIIACLGALGAGGLFFFSNELLALWLAGEKVPDYLSKIVQILAVGGLFLSLQLAPFYLGLAHGHNRTSIILGGMTLCLTAPLLFLGAQKFGLVGAAVPWAVLNLVTFLALSAVIGMRYYGGSFFAWVAKSTAIPVACGGLTMYTARILADNVANTALVACMIGAMFGSMAFCGLGFWAKSRLD